MSADFFDERKVKSNDIVNGLARRDIYDSKGTLLVKKGTRIGEAHYQRMREEGLIQEELQGKKKNDSCNTGINYVSQNSLHGRLDNLIFNYAQLQKKFVEASDSRAKDELIDLVTTLEELCAENIFQVLGELHIAEVSNYNHIKPLYIAASLIELIKRYNRYKNEQLINSKKKLNLVYAALLYNIGLLLSNRIMSDKKHVLSPEEKQQLRKEYPALSIKVMKSIGFTDPVCIDAVQQHNIVAKQPSFEALLLRTPFIYTGIAMPQFCIQSNGSMLNPCREFAQMFAQKKLDPVLGGLFLKINGLAPVGSILVFDSREKAMVIAGPKDDNISSSQLRILTNKSGLQLSRPGDTFYLHKTALVQKGLADHHQFAWSKFEPFTMWER